MSEFAPILLTGFNRPDFLRQQLEFLCELKCRIYLSLDVAKENDLENKPLSDDCKKVAFEFSSKVEAIRISETNLGCDLGISTAITWVFKSEESLIIIEDDVVVEESFLRFATFALSKFANNLTIGSIAGSNFVPQAQITKEDEPYRLSAYTNSWGWATWKNRWSDFLLDRENFPAFDYSFPSEFWSLETKSFWSDIFKQTHLGAYDAWDFRWLYSNWSRSRLTLTSNKNLVLNRGFDSRATHTKSSKIPNWLPLKIDIVSEDDFYLTVSDNIRDINADLWVSKNHFRVGFFHQVRNRISRNLPIISKIIRALKRQTISRVK